MNADRMMIDGCDSCPFNYPVPGTAGRCDHRYAASGLRCRHGDAPNKCPLHQADALVYLRNPKRPR